MAITCGIYDSDSEYGIRLANYITKNSRMPLEVMAFTNKAAIKEYVEDKVLDILIVEEAVEKLVEPEANIVNRLILTNEATEGRDCICKFQSAGRILERVFELAQGIPYKSGKTMAKIYSVYTLEDRKRRNITALNLAYGLGMNAKVIYINLDIFTGVEHILRLNGKKTLSDVMYDYTDKKECITQRISEYAQKYENIDIISGAICPEDIEDIDTDEFVGMIMELAGLAIYDYIVLDVGYIVRKSMKLLEISDAIYLVKETGDVSDYGYREFTDYVRIKCARDLNSKVIQVNLCEDNSMKKTPELLYRGESIVVREYLGRLKLG